MVKGTKARRRGRKSISTDGTALNRKPCKKAAKKLTKFAVRNYTSHYYSEVLENYYLGLVKKSSHKFKPCPVKSGSVLHVMTSAYLSGGHTRIVERWIDSAPTDEMHSVVLIRQRKKKQIPARLQWVVAEKKGTLVRFPYLLSMVWKANQLRKMAMGYKTIVLHQNMTDPVPLMAFGDTAFPRPVIVFNHAGHSFWIGRNAADLVIDIEKSQNQITHHKRGIKNSLLLNLPYDSSESPDRPEKKVLRKQFDLPENSQVLVSMASAYKYTPVLDYNFPEMLHTILQQHTDAVVLIIGVASQQSPDWERLEMDFPNRVRLLGILENKEVSPYLQAADLYLDSFPYSSFTSMLDAVAEGHLPVLCLHNPIGTLSFIEGTDADVITIETMVERSIELLAHPEKREKLYRLLRKRMEQMTHVDLFQQKVHEAYALAKSIQKNKDRFLPIDNKITEFDILSNELCIERKKQ